MIIPPGARETEQLVEETKNIGAAVSMVRLDFTLISNQFLIWFLLVAGECTFDVVLPVFQNVKLLKGTN